LQAIFMRHKHFFSHIQGNAAAGGKEIASQKGSAKKKARHAMDMPR
jgi:hypothetical protein